MGFGQVLLGMIGGSLMVAIALLSLKPGLTAPVSSLEDDRCMLGMLLTTPGIALVKAVGSGVEIAPEE